MSLSSRTEPSWSTPGRLEGEGAGRNAVITGLVPVIHAMPPLLSVSSSGAAWMAGARPAMTPSVRLKRRALFLFLFGSKATKQSKGQAP
jgi:hypothetical protein